MAILESKNVIVGKLTEIGYKKLLEGSFNPKYVILSDDGIDYSLVDLTNTKDPFWKLRNTPIFEASGINEGYKSRLISLPAGYKKLPILKTNTESLNIQLKSSFQLICEMSGFTETGYFIRTSDRSICLPESNSINVIDNTGSVNLFTGLNGMTSGGCSIEIEGFETGVIKTIQVTVTS